MKTWRHLFALLAALALGGCAFNATTIDAEDNRVFLPSVRASVNLTEGKQAPSEPQDGHAVEFEISRATGSDFQILAAGQPPVDLDGRTFSGPQQLKNDFDFSFTDISWRWRRFFGGRSVGLEVRAGLGHAALDLTVSSPTQQAYRHFSTFGPQAGVGVIWRMHPTTSLQARLSGFISGDEGVNRAAHFEFFLAKALHPNFTVRVGYAGWEVKGDRLDFMSDIRLRFSGPVLGLDLNFGP